VNNTAHLVTVQCFASWHSRGCYFDICHLPKPFAKHTHTPYGNRIPLQQQSPLDLIRATTGWETGFTLDGPNNHACSHSLQESVKITSKPNMYAFRWKEDAGVPRENPCKYAHEENMWTPQWGPQLKFEPAAFLLWGDSVNHHTTVQPIIIFWGGDKDHPQVIFVHTLAWSISDRWS